jgi:tRNA (cytidine/uridine-2'-O-)-methyltransferase
MTPTPIAGEPPFHLVLVRPEIPPNTGNIARLCSATGARLHLVGPLGFRLDAASVKRAGLDYWEYLDWRYHADWAQFASTLHEGARLFAVETGSSARYDQAEFRVGDVIVLGSETKGLPPSILEAANAGVFTIPMCEKRVRSLNLANSAAIVLYEALRQTGFPARGPAPETS